MVHDDKNNPINHALDFANRHTTSKDWSSLVKAVSIGIIIVCLGVPMFAFGSGYYLVEKYFNDKNNVNSCFLENDEKYNIDN